MEHNVFKALTFDAAFSFLRLLGLNAAATFCVHRNYRISRSNSSLTNPPTFLAQLYNLSCSEMSSEIT